jgi:hypothetical protein
LNNENIEEEEEKKTNTQIHKYIHSPVGLLYYHYVQQISIPSSVHKPYETETHRMFAPSRKHINSIPRLPHHHL